MTATHCALLRIGNHPETTAFYGSNPHTYRENLNKDPDGGLDFGPESGGYYRPDYLAGQIMLLQTNAPAIFICSLVLINFLLPISGFSSEE